MDATLFYAHVQSVNQTKAWEMANRTWTGREIVKRYCHKQTSECIIELMLRIVFKAESDYPFVYKLDRFIIVMFLLSNTKWKRDNETAINRTGTGKGTHRKRQTHIEITGRWKLKHRETEGFPLFI